MARDINDLWGWVQRLVRRVSRLESGAMLENSSITNGMMRFIGGVLRLDSGALLDLIGQWRFRGNGAITGDVYSEGKWTQVGDWDFSGDGKIFGNVEVLDNGRIKVGNVIISPEGNGRITIGAGSNVIVIDGATGSITIPGANPIVLRQEGGAAKVKVGTSGEISGSDSGIQMMVAGSPNRRFVVTPSNLMIVGVGDVNDPPQYWLGMDQNGTLRRYASSLGGPGGGPLEWPFPESLVTSEFGPRDGGFHEGIDFGTGIAGIEGTPIPAAAAGTVVVAATLHPGWGNYVKVSHGNGLETLYAHMVNPPSVTVGQHVARRQTLGGIGNTGNSFGNHLHFEVHVNGVSVNPRSKLPN